VELQGGGRGSGDEGVAMGGLFIFLIIKSTLFV